MKNTLSRISGLPPKLNKDGFLRSSSDFCTTNDYKTLPLSKGKEWETIARFLSFTDLNNWYTYNFYRLIIDCEKLDKIIIKPHSQLEHGEYFSQVTRKAILKVLKYGWEKGKNDFICRSKSNCSGHSIIKTLEYHPIVIEEIVNW